MAIPEKRVCPSKTIGTHDGTFHCDEVLACWMLQRLPVYKDAEIIRTRDNSKLDTCDIVVDVGAVYDPSRNRFDHHQRSFTGTMKSLADKKWETKLSSAGLVYLHFGEQIIAELSDLSEKDSVTGLLYSKMYDNFIEEIDGIDNGISQYDGEPRYRMTTNLSSRVAGLNPPWNAEDQDTRSGFDKAMEMVGSEFLDRLKFFKDSWLPARTIVEQAINKRFEIDPSGEIMCFEVSGCPWKEHLFNIEEDLGIEGAIKFVLYADNSGKWRVQTVPDQVGSFGFRVGLHEAWRGIRDEELSKLSGIDGCVFVHTSGFIGGNATYEGALKMAKASLQANPEK